MMASFTLCAFFLVVQAVGEELASESADRDCEARPASRDQLLLQMEAKAPGSPGHGVVDRSFLAKGYDFMETDLWTFENVYPTEFFKMDVPESCFRVRMCPRVEIVETNFFDSVEEFSKSFFSSFGIELSGKFMGIEGSLSASMQKSMSQENTEAKAVLALRMYKRGGCYQMRGECAYDGKFLSDAVKDALEGLPANGDDSAHAMRQWEEHFIKRFGTHVSLGSEHGAQVRATATANSNAQGVQSYLRNALKAEISLEWGEQIGGSFGISSENDDEISRRMQSVSFSTRCSTIGGDPEAHSPCISQQESGTVSNAQEVERRLADFFTPQDLATGRSVFSLYLKDMADIFSHMGYHNHSRAMRKATEFHMCKFPQFKWVPKEEEKEEEEEEIETIRQNALHHIQIAGGVSSGRLYLSTRPDGSKVDLHTVDDGSGRQRWNFVKGSGEWYHIVVIAGVDGGQAYLSTTSSGSRVDLYSTDDGSGRQRWTLTKGSGDWYYIKVFDGVYGTRAYLSARPDGSKVDLHTRDDGSGRQRWKIDLESRHQALLGTIQQGAEHTCQCNLQCKNGGILDPESCTCQCKRDSFHGWSGSDCSEEFGTCQMGANSGNQAAASKCAVDNVCASALWKGYCHSTEVCCLTHFKGKCCPFGYTCGCDVNSCECIPPANATSTL